MKKFTEVLSQLNPVDNIEKLELTQVNDDQITSVIENKPGQSGSVAVYYELAQKFNALDKEAAQQGLTLYAEHTQDAIDNPGKHPNIDRLIDITKNNHVYSINVIYK